MAQLALSQGWEQQLRVLTAQLVQLERCPGGRRRRKGGHSALFPWPESLPDALVQLSPEGRSGLGKARSRDQPRRGASPLIRLSIRLC